uniref:Uncharacterized protein n=1 Tax=Anopheles christyi TaxID=43041 RepID=A0A182KBC1_9DIPT
MLKVATTGKPPRPLIASPISLVPIFFGVCVKPSGERGGDKGARTTTLEDTLFRLSKLRERLKAMLRSPAHLIGHGPGAGGGGVVGLHSHASSPPHARPSLFDSCHRKIRLIGGGPVAFLGGLVASAAAALLVWCGTLRIIVMSFST